MVKVLKGRHLVLKEKVRVKTDHDDHTNSAGVVLIWQKKEQFPI